MEPKRNPLYSGRIKASQAEPEVSPAVRTQWQAGMEWSSPGFPLANSLSCLVLSYIGIFPCFFSSNHFSRALIQGFSTLNSSSLPLACIISWVPSTSKGYDINISLLFLVSLILNQNISYKCQWPVLLRPLSYRTLRNASVDTASRVFSSKLFLVLLIIDL